MAGFDNPIGIDLGTTNCCIGFVQNGRVEIIPNIVTDERTTPSYVFFDGIKTHVGKLAVTNAVLHPERVVYDSKRMIGRRFDDNNIQKNLVYWRFHVEEGRDSKPVIQISKKHGVVTYTPEDVSSIILRQLKSYAEKFTGKPVKNAVITVPAYFNYNQRTATQRAAEDAGFHVLQIINEPTAAALAYVDINYKDTNCENTILIYDLGGGTFDVSILRVEKNENEQVFKVLATSGDTYLGGRDFDNNLIELILKKIEGKDVKVTNKLKRRISALVTKTKIDLTEAETADVILPFVASVDDDEDFVININREEFEEVNLDLFKRTIDILRKCLDDANIEKKQINEVVLVGGSSKIPKIRKMIKEFFGNVNVSESVSSSEAVAYGATLKAWTFDEESSKSLIISDVTPLSIGLEVLGGTIDCILRRNTSIPKEVTRKCHTSLDKQKSMMFAIYEGERLLAKDNTKLGSFILDLPEKPIGYSIPVSFCLDENGILNVHAEIETGIYRNLQITYEATDVAKATNVIQEAALAKTVDASVARRIDQIVNFEIYLNRVLALCQRCTAFTESEKDTLTNTSEECLKVLKAFTAGNVTEEIAEEALDKREVVEGIIEPILELHEIRIKYKTSEEFYKMLINM